MLYCQLTPEQLQARLRQFVDALLRAINTENTACALAPDSILVFTKDETLPDRLFSELRHDSVYHRIPFTISEAVKGTGQTPELLLQQAMLRIKCTYTLRKSAERDALFDKLCQLQADIRCRPESDWRIEEIADGLHISRGHLQKTYKQYFGTSIIETVIELRMDMAKRLLKETEKSVTEIAELCGYVSYVYFTKQFKKTVGMTPSEYWHKQISGAD